MRKWQRPPQGNIPSENLGTIYKLVEKAIEETNKNGKSTNEIFGEIYTRFRSHAIAFGMDIDFKRLFSCKLKLLKGTPAGKELNRIINELYAEQDENESSMMNLELCTTIMDSCVLDAKNISVQSEKIISHLEQINQNLSGGS